VTAIASRRFASCRRAIRRALARHLVSALHPSTPAWELLRLSPSDSGSSPLTPSSPGPRLSGLPEPRMISTRCASTLRASFIPGACPRRSAIEATLAPVSRDQSFHRRFHGHEPSTTCHLSATLPPRLGFRALFSARSRPAFAFRALRRRHRSSDGNHPISLALARAKGRSIGGASLADDCLVHPIREHDRRIAEPRWLRCDAFKTLSGRAGMPSSCPIGSVAMVVRGLAAHARDRFQPRFRSLSRPLAAEPVQPSQEPEPMERIHRCPAGSQRPLLARRPFQSLVTPTRRNRAPLVADLVMSEGD